MIRKIVLASFLAILLSATAPAWAAPDPTTPADNANAEWSALPLGNDEAAGEPAATFEIPASAAQTEAPMAQPMAMPEGMPAAPSVDALSNFGPSSGTVVGNRALELRDEVLRLRSSVNLNAHEFALLRSNGAAGAVQYHSTVAAITARLQNGTTRGNPILLRQWEEAESSLNEVTNSLNRLNALQTSVAADSSLSAYMLESIQAGFLLSGAVDEDHDQLKLLRDEVSRLIVQLDYLRNQVADDIQRQTNYLTTERGNLQALAFAITRGELLGNSLANRPVIVNPSPVMMLPQTGQANRTGYQRSSYAPSPSAAPAGSVSQVNLGPAPMSPRNYLEQTSGLSNSPPYLPTGDVGVAPSIGRLLALVRYNQPYVDYEQQLSTAVSAALQRKADLQFSIVAVTPMRGDPSDIANMQEQATRHAEDIKRSLVQLGLAPSRITMASTQTADAQVPEVHVYVR